MALFRRMLTLRSIQQVIAWNMVLVTASVFPLMSEISVSSEVAGLDEEVFDARLLHAR